MYLLCNQVKDCPGGVDELHCHDLTCPGHFRCWHSQVCLHADHVCDGIKQCPHQDDELLCDLVCPLHCQCQGLAFVCSQPFPAQQFPQLRYLDAHHSKMTPEQLYSNYLLVYVKLSNCGIASVNVPSLQNLVTLDLAENEISHLDMNRFMKLVNLQVLVLRKNKLMSLTSNVVQSAITKLSLLDLSFMDSSVLETSHLKTFLNLTVLNISHSKVR